MVAAYPVSRHTLLHTIQFVLPIIALSHRSMTLTTKLQFAIDKATKPLNLTKYRDHVKRTTTIYLCTGSKPGPGTA